MMSGYILLNFRYTDKTILESVLHLTLHSIYATVGRMFHQKLGLLMFTYVVIWSTAPLF